MNIHVVENRILSIRYFVRGASLNDAHEFGGIFFLSMSYSTHPPNTLENLTMGVQTILDEDRNL